MTTGTVPSSTLDFLRDLRANNNRNWFNAHKDRYRAEHQHMIDFAESLQDRFSQYDELEPQTGKQILFRIYRDVRFSKNKSPYKVCFSGHLKRATRKRRGGYYFHIEPGASMIGGGFWAPEREDLLRIRQELAADAEPLREIIADPTFRETFGTLGGEQLKTAPKGFPRDHPNIDLLRYKQYIVSHDFTDEEVLAPEFIDRVVDSFRRMLPFFNYMSWVLTHDANGEPIVE